MKRLVGMATVSGLTMSIGLLGFADGASAAPAARPPAPPGAANAAAPAKAAPPAKPAGAKPATPGRSSNAAAAKGQAKAAAGRNVPAAAAARSNRPGSANRATGQARAARVHALNAAAAAQRDAAAPAAADAAAPVAAAAEPGGGQTKVLLCHATSSDTNPYSLIEVASPAAVNAHLGHGDIAPVGGTCPVPIVPPAVGATVAICHRTGVEGTPFSLLDVNATDLPAHVAHGDVATVGGVCPGAVVLPTIITQPTAGPVPAVRVAAITEATPARVEQQLLSTRVRAAENTGALPVTGVEVGSLVVVGLAMLVVGGRLVRSGRLRRASASTATA